MGKGHYLGGGTLLGCGRISKRRGRGRGGLVTSGDAVREQKRQAERKIRKNLAAKNRRNQSLLFELSQEWADEKGRRHYQRLSDEDRAKVSPLAEAILRARKKEK